MMSLLGHVLLLCCAGLGISARAGGKILDYVDSYKLLQGEGLSCEWLLTRFFILLFQQLMMFIIALNWVYLSIDILLTFFYLFKMI